MSKRKPYWTCSNCGSNLDHGERCDCQDTKNNSENDNSKK